MITTLKDTIAAISTPIGFGGIGIIRISGSGSFSIAQKLFRKHVPTTSSSTENVSQKIQENIIPRQLQHGYIINPEKKGVSHEVLMAYMPSPKSYTREDVIEIQAHGGTESLKSILEIVVENGARMAEAGEFTRRAYINGRIDLPQAEAIIDIIQAKTEAALRIANRTLEGKTGELVRKIRKSLFNIKAMLEVSIDFSEDIEENLNETEIKKTILREILDPINDILEAYRHGQLLREGARLVIVGRTNVGKSSLLNRLLQKERAIVTHYPGTTRDSIEESINLFGIPAVVVDTAGWRNTTEPVEKIGIENTLTLIKNADLILFMVEAGTGIVSEDTEFYLKIENYEKMLVINKADLMQNGGKIPLPDRWRFKEPVYISAKFGNGLDRLKKRIYEQLMKGGIPTEIDVVPNLRQKNLVLRARQASENVMNGVEEKRSPELIAIDLQEAIGALDEITGEVMKEDVLDEIFSRFCVGK